MRVQVTLKTKCLPISYHFLFVSVIKQSLSCIDEKLVQDLYTFKDKSNKCSKDFTFSVYVHKYVKKQDEFIVDGHVKWIVSSSDPEFMLYLYNGLMTKQHFQYKDYDLYVKQVNLIPEKLPTKEKIFCKTMSPIHIKNKEGHTLSPYDDSFQPAFQYISNQTVLNATGMPLREAIKMTPVDMKKVIVKQQHDAFRKLNDKSTLYVEAYRGTFELEGSVQDLQTLYQIGLGMRRSQGFGNIEIIKG
ncbi:CRISPR-associated endoribonuclease Cas6 [Bacillus pseudomycoides]|uniref:CRISPR-associated endoribonuclease Cas6 n=1 Tax=Bacillus pseudomycoides TaxID=64104 RepID=UPI0014833D6E|nr:CRISPR-associated endoribonuclease Cas6 [Bacillus pseudomycoides]